MVKVALYVLTLFSCAVFVLGSSCHDGWIHYGKSCYLFKDTKEEWGTAEYVCSALGSKLLEVESSMENNFIKRQIAERHPDFKTGDYVYWTGGNDLEVEGNFIWTKTRLPFTFTDWFKSQPQIDGSDEDCVAYRANKESPIQWHDYPCNSAEFFICEMGIEEDLTIVG